MQSDLLLIPNFDDTVLHQLASSVHSLPKKEVVNFPSPANRKIRCSDHLLLSRLKVQPAETLKYQRTLLSKGKDRFML